MTYGDPWVPPSVASSSGLASSGLAISGASIPLQPTGSSDLLTAYTGSGGCDRHVTSWSWSGDTLTVAGSVVGTYCYSGSDLVGFPYDYAADCVVIAPFTGPSGGSYVVGQVISGVVGQTTSIASDSYSSFGCAIGPYPVDSSLATPWRFRINYSDAWHGEDGLVVYLPGVSLPVSGSVLTTCSDGSTVTVDFAAGSPLVAAGCTTGVVASVDVVVGGVLSGHVGIETAFQGSPCLASATACAIVANYGSPDACANNDPSCPWWGQTSPATSCSWRDPTGDGWDLPTSDCEAARDLGVHLPPPSSSPTPTVTAAPSGGSTTINVSVTVAPTINVTVTNPGPDQNPAGGCSRNRRLAMASRRTTSPP